MKTRKKPQRPLTKAMEELIQPYRVTGFECNICDDVLLLAAGIISIPRVNSGFEFLEPDFSRMNIVHYDLSKEEIEIFYKFLKKHDATVTLCQNKEDNKNKIIYNLNCQSFLENIFLIFKAVFLEKIGKNPNFLIPYQEQCREYFDLPEDIVAEKNTYSKENLFSSFAQKSTLDTQDVLKNQQQLRMN